MGFIFFIAADIKIPEIILFFIPLFFPFNSLGELVQFLTTNKPEEANLELAIAALTELERIETLDSNHEGEKESLYTLSKRFLELPYTKREEFLDKLCERYGKDLKEMIEKFVSFSSDERKEFLEKYGNDSGEENRKSLEDLLEEIIKLAFKD